MFEIKNVSKKYEEEYALHELSMKIGKGLNFIVGASGSGKTTLLKIISGMEQSFDGEVLYCGQSIKALTNKEKSYFYNNVFGFVWQDFNLIDELSVIENIMLPRYLKENKDVKAVRKILCALNIEKLADQKVSTLSGGQKQRVAIARELIKDPQVIICDEPTSALDEESAKIIMDLLRNISKKRTVIVVTHDTSLINKTANVYELDKGELITNPDPLPNKISKVEMKSHHTLSLTHAYRLGIQNVKSKGTRFATLVVSIVVSSLLLLVMCSGAISNSSQSAFDTLFDTYGQNLLDINLVGSFVSASGTDDTQNEEPNADVTQDINGLYDTYLDDERVSHIVSLQAFTGIKVTVDGNQHTIQSSGNMSSINELTCGEMPMGNGNEVVVPQSFVKMMGLTEEEALGKTIEFEGFVYNWSSGEPVEMPISITANIVGVADTTVKYESNGEMFEFSVDDSFFFSKDSLEAIRTQGGIENSDSSFSIRAKTPADMIEIKNELNADGIVPLGQFELVEDTLRIENQTTTQSDVAVKLIAILSILITLAITIMSAFTRKKEYAIYKISGYATTSLSLLIALEFFVVSFISALVFLVISPVSNLATTSFWNVDILNVKLLALALGIIVMMGILSCIVTIVVSKLSKTSTALKSGSK